MSSNSSRELPTDRLATSDQQGRRIYLYSAEVKGRFRTARTWTHSILILVFLLLPWMHVHGHQAILMNIMQRRFAIFGLTFWAHDAPMLVFLIGGAALTLGLVTAVWGRAWCGWACPQTVFIDSLFRVIERVVEGDHVARRKLDTGGWTFDKFYKKCLKWLLYSTFTLVVAHSFIAYFVGTDELSRMIRHSPAENPLSFSVMLAITGFILFDFGWFREQFCTMLCPYGRFQCLLMDEHSTLVTYDVRRGEPRKGLNSEGTPGGDCVNCYRCVQVCPTGIDIRRGTQLECIGCTACIDACDDVMTRLHKPRGLIRHASAVALQGGKSKIIRGRTIVYSLLLAGIIMGLITSIATRRPVEAAFIRATDTPYQEIKTSTGSSVIINHFKTDLSNQSFDGAVIDLLPTAEYANRGVEFVFAGRPLHIQAGQKAGAEFFIKFPKSLLVNGHTQIALNIMNGSAIVLTEELSLVGPYL
ncbi:MAG: cytochrome c oxidase accessory protein CcoG [Deltaproteobacteria bacterium]|nr:cytochrome c oxidase accessory protein CcoG [Deltaproteobacteria bacterium]